GADRAGGRPTVPVGRSGGRAPVRRGGAQGRDGRAGALRAARPGWARANGELPLDSAKRNSPGARWTTPPSGSRQRGTSVGLHQTELTRGADPATAVGRRTMGNFRWTPPNGTHPQSEGRPPPSGDETMGNFRWTPPNGTSPLCRQRA